MGYVGTLYKEAAVQIFCQPTTPEKLLLQHFGTVVYNQAAVHFFCQPTPKN